MWNFCTNYLRFMSQTNLKAIAIDDEDDSLAILRILLERYCPQVSLVATFTDPHEAIQYIHDTPPELLFLDISMPTLNGFELLEQVKQHQMEVIFTTAHDEYAIQAFQVGALHYLLKPIDRTDLVKSVERVLQRRPDDALPDIQSILLQVASMRRPKMAVSTLKGIEIIDIDDIVYCEASSNYTLVFFTERKMVVTKTLKEMEQQLRIHNFFRIHHSYLINMAHLRNFLKTDGGYVTLSNGKQLSVSRSRKPELMQRLGDLE